MLIERLIRDQIIDYIKTTNKIIVIYGARQTGKTTLSESIIKSLNMKTLRVDGDQKKYIDVLSSRDLARIDSLISGNELLFIDEAQRIPEIGINLKIIHDNRPDIKIIVTGSSSLNIASEINESLTGRKITFSLFPIAVSELKLKYSSFEINQKLDELLIFGSYPEVFTAINHNVKIRIIDEIGSSFLYKDILELADIQHKNKLNDLLRLLAFQIGHQVSVNELSRSLGISRAAIDNYINLLEQSFIIFRLSGFSRNLRKEITKMDKIYFNDLGIRNMIINNFNTLPYRNDIGQLWENFIISERIKHAVYTQTRTDFFYWRTYTGAELDYIEEREGKLFGYEIKYSKSRAKPPETWLDTYKNADFQIINKDNYMEFI